jgi:hypothetical protein
MKVRIEALGVAVAFVAAACGGAPETKPASTPAQQVPATPAATTPAATTGEAEFGVPECDSYIKKYMACIDKVPEPAKAMVRQSLDQSKAQFKQAAATPQGKAGLAMACQQADAAAKQAMSVYGCSW